MNILNIFKKTYTVTVYMNSGNRIVLKKMAKFDIKKEGPQVVRVEWEGGSQQIMNLNVDQIEAVIVR